MEFFCVVNFFLYQDVRCSTSSSLLDVLRPLVNNTYADIKYKELVALNIFLLF